MNYPLFPLIPMLTLWDREEEEVRGYTPMVGGNHTNLRPILPIPVGYLVLQLNPNPSWLPIKDSYVRSKKAATHKKWPPC